MVKLYKSIHAQQDANLKDKGLFLFQKRDVIIYS
jgi:hypothetical protein